MINIDIGINLARTGEIQEGINRLKRALIMEEGITLNDKIFLNSEIAYWYGELRDVDNALEYLYKAEKLGRNDSWLLYQLGLALKEYGNIEEAINVFKEEIEITDYKGFGDLQLAWCYALIDEKEKAKKYFENVDKYLASSLEKDEELKKDYKIVKELINSNIYFN